MLTENDFNQSIEKWLEEVASSMSVVVDGSGGKHPFGKAAIDDTKLEKLTKIGLGKLGNNDHAVYDQLGVNLLAFFKGVKGDKITLSLLGNYIQQGIAGIDLPKFNKTYEVIKDDSVIYDELSNVNFLKDVLLQSIDVTDEEYYLNDEGEGGKREEFDNFAEKIPTTLANWKEEVVKAISAIDVVGVPDASSILSAVEKITNTYMEEESSPMKVFYNRLKNLHSAEATTIKDAFVFDAREHCKRTTEVILTTKLTDNKNKLEVAKEWWKLLKGRVDNETSTSLAANDTLLPSPLRIAACFKDNIEDSPKLLHEQLRIWASEVKGAISLAVLGVDNKKVKVSGSSFKEHLKNLFEPINIPDLINRIVFNIPDYQILAYSEDEKQESMVSIWKNAISKENFLDYVSASESEPGMLFLSLYEDGRVDDLKSLCTAPLTLLPSSNEIALAAYRTLKGKPVSTRKKIVALEKKIVDLKVIQSIHGLHNEVLDQFIAFENIYKSFSHKGVKWIHAVEKVTLVYCKAYRVTR